MENIEETKIEHIVNNLQPTENKIYYSKRLNGFIFDMFNKEEVREEDIEISEEEHRYFIEETSKGKILYLGEDGYPTLKDRDPPTQEQTDNLNRRLRSLAYVEESDPLFFKSQRGEATNQEWIDKIKEIKSRYPISSEETEALVK